jgi:hypothetical protein
MKVTDNNTNILRKNRELRRSLSKQKVLNRIDDWEKRVHDLFLDIEIWIKDIPNVTLVHTKEMEMYEELMWKYKIPSRKLETANILMDGKIIMALRPYGLWIIGANGRIDLLYKNGGFYIIDNSEKYKSPIWKLYSTNNKEEPKDFNKNTFMELLSLCKLSQN